MYELLENGDIRCGVPARSEDDSLRGSIVTTLKPGDPSYKKAIRFLNPDHRERATHIADEAERVIAAK